MMCVWETCMIIYSKHLCLKQIHAFFSSLDVVSFMAHIQWLSSWYSQQWSVLQDGGYFSLLTNPTLILAKEVSNKAAEL